MNDKNLIKKLYKVAQKQQKIIKKLAQAQLKSTKNVTNEVNEIIGQLRTLPQLGIVCLDAQLSELDNKLNGKIKVENGKPGDPVNRTILSAITKAVADKMGLSELDVKFVLVFGDMVS